MIRIKRLLSRHQQKLGVVITAATFIPLTVLLILRHLSTPHSSDDVAVQVALSQWLQGLHHTVFLPSDNYLFKLPVYLITELLPVDPGHKLLLQVLALNLICFIAFLMAIVWLVPKAAQRSRAITLMPVLWLTVLGGAFGFNMLVANYRNIELGLVFLVIAVAYRYTEGKTVWNQWWTPLALTSLSLFWFSDPYFLLLAGVPLMVFIWIWYFMRGRDQRLLYVSLVVAASALVSKLWPLMLRPFGVEIGGGASISLAGLPHHLELLLPSLASLLGVSFHTSLGRSLVSLLTVSVVIVGVIACCCNAWVGWRGKRFFDCFVAVQPAVIVAGFILSSYTYDIGAGRYLVLAMFYLTLALVALLARLRSSLLRTILVLLLACAALGNIAIDLKELSNRRIYSGTAEQNQFLAGLRAAGIAKGYGQYWSANIASYLNAGRPTIVPIDCTSDAQIKPLYWFMDDAPLLRPSRDTFYIYEDNVPQAAVCPLSALERQFGRPRRTIEVSQHIHLLLYDYDISQKFVSIR